MKSWFYTLHYISSISETVYLDQLSVSTNKTHRAYSVGTNSYRVVHTTPFRFYAWRVGGRREVFAIPSPKCDWMVPLRIARITYGQVNNDYFDDCDIGQDFKARLPAWGFGDRVQAMVAAVTWASLLHASKLTFYWTPPAKMVSTLPMQKNSIFDYFYVDDPRVHIVRRLNVFRKVEGRELTFKSGLQNVFPYELSLILKQSEPNVQTAFCDVAYGLIKPSTSMHFKLETLPKYNISLHVRRTNKVRNIGMSDFETKPDELSELNRLTKNALGGPSSYTYVCGDSANDTNEFEKYLKNRKVVAPILNNEIERLFFDYFAIGRAQRVITSQRYSSFSMSSALVHGRNISVVFARDKLRRRRPVMFGACSH